MAERIGGARQRAFLSRLGLTEKSLVELPEVGAPLCLGRGIGVNPRRSPPPSGHGIAVNSIQLAARGRHRRPTTACRCIRPCLKPTCAMPVRAPKKEHVISPHTSALMRALMRLVVTRGTGKEAAVAGYMMGGKTGTADKIVNHHLLTNARLSSFVGVFPINRRVILCSRCWDDPKGKC